jgi:hypothetical protein
MLASPAQKLFLIGLVNAGSASSKIIFMNVFDPRKARMMPGTP